MRLLITFALLFCYGPAVFAQFKINGVSQFPLNTVIAASSSGVKVLGPETDFKIVSKPDQKIISQGDHYRIEWKKDSDNGNWQVSEAIKGSTSEEPAIAKGVVHLARYNSSNFLESYSECYGQVSDSSVTKIARKLGTDSQRRELSGCATVTKETCEAINDTVGMVPGLVQLQIEACENVGAALKRLSTQMHSKKYKRLAAENNAIMEAQFKIMNRPKDESGTQLFDFDFTKILDPTIDPESVEAPAKQDLDKQSVDHSAIIYLMDSCSRYKQAGGFIGAKKPGANAGGAAKKAL